MYILGRRSFVAVSCFCSAVLLVAVLDVVLGIVLVLVLVLVLAVGPAVVIGDWCGSCS